MLCIAACGQSELPSSADSETGTREEAIAFRNATTEVGYVGDDACFSCHEEAYRGYQEHGMAHSFYPLTAENVVEDFSDVVIAHEATGEDVGNGRGTDIHRVGVACCLGRDIAASGDDRQQLRPDQHDQEGNRQARDY